jgi:hypothetical protein
MKGFNLGPGEGNLCIRFHRLNATPNILMLLKIDEPVNFIRISLVNKRQIAQITTNVRHTRHTGPAQHGAIILETSRWRHEHSIDTNIVRTNVNGQNVFVILTRAQQMRQADQASQGTKFASAVIWKRQPYSTPQ